MINLKSQSGRSMVEILGVLSIIGVLSVVGINAYSTAIKKHKANELLK
jgi:Tfp pilus assembly protein PilE